MKTINAPAFYTQAETAERFAGKLLTAQDIDLVVNETCCVLKPDGTPLLILLKNVIPPPIVAAAYPALRSAATQLTISNRGLATGRIRFSGDVSHLFIASHGGELTEKTRLRPKLRNGTFSRTSYAIGAERIQRILNENRITVEVQLSTGEWIPKTDVPLNGVVGYLDRNSRFPYCRLTAFSLNNPRYHASIIPFAQAVDQVFAQQLPERYAAQQRMIQQTQARFYISNTVFTTITVNMNFVTAVHQDAGDLKAGFGVMSCLRQGNYTGSYTAFPRYRVGADMATGDVLLADVHEWHGNTPLTATHPFERIATVFYYRENMQHCEAPEQELARVKATKGVAHLKDWQ